ncbi:MAG TPA: hypothetical protein VFI90_03925, partial [Rubrobacter sp.]|nr:hypothetical protein [Rubrobacter sp.]
SGMVISGHLLLPWTGLQMTLFLSQPTTQQTSREHSAALRSYPMDLELWDKFANEPGADDDLIRQGRAILRFQDVQVEMICRKAYFRKLGGHKVPVVNSSCFWSEVGHKMLEDGYGEEGA